MGLSMSMSRTAPSLCDSSGRASFVGILRSCLATAAKAIAREQRVTRDFRHLRSLDDHMLQDIGISRAELEPFAMDRLSGLRGWPLEPQRDTSGRLLGDHKAE